MLEAEIDVFSGMPNPTFELSDKEEQELLDRIVAEAGQMSAVADPAESFGLGYRGIVVRVIKSNAGPWSKAKRPGDVSIPGNLATLPGGFPLEFRLGSKPAKADSA